MDHPGLFDNRKKTMPIKQYESLRFSQESIIINVKGKHRRVNFTGGITGPKGKGGTFITSDPQFQKALEGKSDFARRFKIVMVHDTDPEREQKAQCDLEDLKKLARPDTPELLARPIEKKLAPAGDTVSEITGDPELEAVLNAQQAKEYLVKKIEGTTFRQVANKAMILALATKHGIKFPNWKTD